MIQLIHVFLVRVVQTPNVVIPETLLCVLVLKITLENHHIAAPSVLVTLNAHLIWHVLMNVVKTHVREAVVTTQVVV